MPMSAVRRAVFTIFCFSVCAQAQTRTLAVYSNPPQHLESSTLHALQVELQRVLTPAGMDMIWVQSALQPEAQLAVVGSFEGDCSVETLPDQAVRAIHTRTLADSSVSG